MLPCMESIQCILDLFDVVLVVHIITFSVSETDKDRIQTYHQQNIPHIPSIKVSTTIRSSRQLPRVQTSDKLKGVQVFVFALHTNIFWHLNLY